MSQRAPDGQVSPITPNLRDARKGEVKVVRVFLVGLVECGGCEGVPTPRQTRPVPLGRRTYLHDERRCPAGIETEHARAELQLHQIAMAPVSRRRGAPSEQLP